MSEGVVIASIITGGITISTAILRFSKNGKHNGKPEDNGVSKVLDKLTDVFKPLHERQIAILDKMNERDVEMARNVQSNHQYLKDLCNKTEDINTGIDRIFADMPKRKVEK